MPRYCLYLLFQLLLGLPAFAQTAEQNPFDIPERLTESELAARKKQALPPDTTSKQTSNPFDIRPETSSPHLGRERDVNQSPLLIRRGTDPSFLDARGRSLGIHILLLFFTALLWIFFRPILSDIFLAAFNEGLFAQLYRRRESGQFGVFFIAYGLFFLAAGFFVYLIGQTFDWFPSDQPWRYWVNFTGILFLILLAKHLLLHFLGWLFELKTDMGKYSFIIMLFAIIGSMLLVPLNLLISYAPSSFTSFFAYLALAIVCLLYLFRSFRALLIANKHLSANFLYFLLYLCAVELAPAWVFYLYIQA